MQKNIVNVIRLKVFVDKKGNFGDVATIVIDDRRQLSDSKRIEITRELQTAETVFINDIKHAEISIMHYDGEIDFAGVGALAAAWQISQLKGEPIKVMKSRGGVIHISHLDDLVLVIAATNTLPPWKFKKVATPNEVLENTAAKAKNLEHTMVWAWENESQGSIRARTFANDWGIPEAEGNGSGAMKLAAMLGRSVEITHGKGSVIYARHISDKNVALGGRVAIKT